MPRLWFKNMYFAWKGTKTPWKTADSRSGAGNVQDEFWAYCCAWKQRNYQRRLDDVKRCYTVLSLFRCVWLFVTLWTVARKASPSMEFSRQGHGSGLPFPPPGDFLDLGIKPTPPVSPALQTDSLPTEPLWKSPGWELIGWFDIQESKVQRVF